MRRAAARSAGRSMQGDTNNRHRSTRGSAHGSSRALRCKSCRRPTGGVMRVECRLLGCYDFRVERPVGLGGKAGRHGSMRGSIHGCSRLGPAAGPDRKVMVVLGLTGKGFWHSFMRSPSCFPGRSGHPAIATKVLLDSG